MRHLVLLLVAALVFCGPLSCTKKDEKPIPNEILSMQEKLKRLKIEHAEIVQKLGDEKADSGTMNMLEQKLSLLDSRIRRVQARIDAYYK